MSESAEIRQVRSDDHAAVNAFLASLGLTMPTPGAAAKGYWLGRWEANPACALHDPAVGNGWVLEDGGEIVGFFGNLPLAGVMGTRDVRIACASTWAVDANHRHLTEALCERYFGQQDVDVLLVTSAIKPTARRFEQFGGAPVPQAGCADILYWVVDTIGFLTSAFRKKGRGRVMARVLGILGAIPLDFSMRILGRRPFGILDRITPVKVDDIDEAFDALWERRRAQLPATLLARRDAATLRWYFGLGAEREQTRVLRFDEGGVLKGYAVLMRDDAPAIGLKRMKIVDLFVDGDDPKVAKALLAAAYEYAFAKNCHVVEVIGLAEPLRQVALSAKPFTRRMATFPFFYKALAPDLEAPLAEPGAWALTAYDGDSALL